MIKDIQKRKELEDVIYNRYSPSPTQIEKLRLQREVGSMLDGYEIAINEIKSQVNSGASPQDILNYIHRIII